MKYLILLLFSCSAWARPVGYQGAINGLSFTKGDRSENSLHYSPKYYYSFGVRSLFSDEFKFNGLYGSYLLKRWNLPEAQSNIFTYGAVGVDQNEQFMGHYGIQADYETRQIYTLYNYQAYNGKNNLFDNHMVRLGFAPYKAGFDDLNLWLIGEYNSSDNNLTPLVRMFYKNVLWEVGYNRDQEVLFNIMFQIMY